MPLLLALAAMLLLVAMLIVTLPLSVVSRYRQGTRRRKARRWLVSLNLLAALVSTAMFLVSASLISLRDPRALPYALVGFAVGGVLGLLGLALTRWDADGDALHYTPSRVLIGSITLVVAARVTYGIYRAWRAVGVSDGESWLVEAGIANSLAFGAIVLGYYTAFFSGLRGRLIRQHRRG